MTYGHHEIDRSAKGDPVERVVEPGEALEEEARVELGEGRAEGLHDAEEDVEAVKGDQA